jgi:hypothetical protein
VGGRSSKGGCQTPWVGGQTDKGWGAQDGDWALCKQLVTVFEVGPEPPEVSKGG